MAAPQPFVISDLRGGVNDSDSRMLLGATQMRDARNIDFRAGACGSKRRGSQAIATGGSIFDSPIIALFTHTPSNDDADDELWGIDENGHVDRRVAGVWQGGVARENDYVVVSASNYEANAVSLHGKLFIATRGSQDRLLVWDGTKLRWAGIAAPPPPTGGSTAPAGAYASTRYFRIRYVQQASGAVIRRSEPSTVLTFAPPGNKDGVTLTKPAGTEATTSVRMEGQTHWEVEASLDNTLFYRIATVAIGTTTYTDTTSAATGYAANPLSENSGEYLPPGSARHVAIDEDRLMVAGSYFTPGEDSTVWWTPVQADDGVGNDERLPQETKQFIRFDGLSGGRVTAIVGGVNGNVYVFKKKRIYKMVRTGILASAYAPVTETWSRGAMMRGAVAGLDEKGLPCVYFVDQNKGLCRFGQRGAEDLGGNVEKTWKRRNKSATIGPRLLHYPDLDQVWVSLPLDDNDTPSQLLVYETQYSAALFHDGVPATAVSFTLFANSAGTYKPVFGAGNLLFMGDTGTTDNGAFYSAYGITRPYLLGGLFQMFGLKAGAVLATSTGASLLVEAIRDFGKESKSRLASTAPEGTEEYVLVDLPELAMSGLRTLEVKFGDNELSAQEWSLEHMAFLPGTEEQLFA